MTRAYQPAPSTWAAAYRSRSIIRSPARTIRVTNGMDFQESATMIDQKAAWGLLRNVIGWAIMWSEIKM